MSNEKKILIIDDDHAIVDALKLMLEMAEYTVFTSDNRITLQNIIDLNPHGILLDMWMPGTNGVSLCKGFKKNPQIRTIPVIMISASKDGEKEAIKAGANAFIAKPFEMEDILSCIDKQIKTL